MSAYQELLAQREELEKKINEARRIEVSAAITQVKQLIAEYELTARDCGFKLGGDIAAPEKVRTPVAAKYRGPEGQVWSGRGRAPNWLTALESQGRDKSEFLI
jgi:DNA-binding protein H-NS